MICLLRSLLFKWHKSSSESLHNRTKRTLGFEEEQSGSGPQGVIATAVSLPLPFLPAGLWPTLLRRGDEGLQ